MAYLFYTHYINITIESEEILKNLKKEPQKKHEKCDLLGYFWENMV